MRTAYLLTGDAHLAEDLVQSALVKLATRWERVVAGVTRRRTCGKCCTTSTSAGGGTGAGIANSSRAAGA
jgi:hypothetical protein